MKMRHPAVRALAFVGVRYIMPFLLGYACEPCVEIIVAKKKAAPNTPEPPIILCQNFLLNGNDHLSRRTRVIAVSRVIRVDRDGPNFRASSSAAASRDSG